MLASRHIKREKASLPVDVCRSKTPLLKLHNHGRLLRHLDEEDDGKGGRGEKKETRIPALALPSFYILKICWKLKKITPTRTFLEEALRTFAWEATKETTLDDQNLVCYTAFFSVVTQHSSPQVSGEEHCVTTLKTAV